MATKKIFKLFGKKIWETEIYGQDEEKPIEIPKGKPEGMVLNFTLEDLEKEKNGNLN